MSESQAQGAGAGNWSFAGKRVLVTGASRGIGYGIAGGFARAGADLILLADDEEVHAAADRLGKLGGRPTVARRCDITDRAGLARAFVGIDRVDVLVNNAGLERMTPIDAPGDEAEALFRRIIDINIIGTYYVTREALTRMGPGGRIILTASIWGKTAVARFSAYCASKHANLGFMRSLAHELGPRGIAVNAICPGWTKTETSMRSVRDDALARGITEDDVARELLARQAFPGLLVPEDLVDTYLFLASDAARNITGQSIHVDRGDVMD